MDVLSRHALILVLIALISSCAAPEPAPKPEPSVPTATELYEEAMEEFRSREYSAAGRTFQLAAVAAELSGSDRVMVEASAMVARCGTLTRNPGLTSLWIGRARERARRTEPHGFSMTEQVTGIIQREAGDPEGALRTFESLHRYCLDHDLLERAIDAAHHAAIVAPLKDQVHWAQRGISAAEATGDERWQAVLWNNLGRTHEQLGEFPKMLLAYENARRFHRRTGGEREAMIADWAVGRAQRFNGDLATAERTLRRVLEVALDREARAEPGSSEWVGYTRWELGEIYLEKEDTRAAAELKLALETLVEAGLDKSWPAGMAELRASLERAQP